MAQQWVAGTVAGQVLTAATLNTIGAQWESYTPTLTQSVTVTKTTSYARYCQFQKTVIVQVYLVATSAGTAAQEVVVGLPLTATGSTGRAIGTGFIYDASANVIYNMTSFLATTTTAKFFWQSGFGFGFSPNIALANGDQLAFTFTYEVP